MKVYKRYSYILGECGPATTWTLATIYFALLLNRDQSRMTNVQFIPCVIHLLGAVLFKA